MAGLQHDDVDFVSDVKAGYSEKKLASEDDHALSELDGIHDGLEFPTEEEKRTLPRVPDAIPWNAYCMFFSFIPLHLSSLTFFFFFFFFA
jgi:proton-dependent oligopeptide transporter, POT family